MRAIRVHEFGPSSVLKYETVPDPTPGPGEVLISVKAVGVNPVDTYIRAGVYGPREFPFTPGMDAAGVIEALGEGVTELSVGDRVYTGTRRAPAPTPRKLSRLWSTKSRTTSRSRRPPGSTSRTRPPTAR